MSWILLSAPIFTSQLVVVCCAVARCIELAPDFVKGYSRKGTLQFFMKEYDKALQTYEQGLKHEPDNQELKDGVMRCLESINRLAHGEQTGA